MQAEPASDTTSAFDQLRKHTTRYVVYKIKDLTICVDKISSRNVSYKDLMDYVSDTCPSFIVYDYEFVTADGRTSSKMIFIYWKPLNTSQNEKIVYSQALHKFRASLAGVEYAEVEDEDELRALLSKEVLDTRRLSKE